VVKRKELPLLENIRITDIGAEGNAVARIENLVIFIPFAAPGDVADILVKRKRKNYLEGIIARFEEFSKDRIEPRCLHFGTCGGCRWQHLPYRLQLHYKEKQVIDNLLRIGKAEPEYIKPIVASEKEYFYRNKLEFTFSDKRWLTQEEIKSDHVIQPDSALGFHISGLFDKVLDIRECFFQAVPSNLIRNTVREYALKNKLPFFNLKEQTGFLRNLIIRNNSDGQFMVIVVFSDEDKNKRESLLDFLAENFPEISSLMYALNTKRNDFLGDIEVSTYNGDDHLIDKLNGLKFRIGPKSFYQTNSKQAAVLYGIVKEMAGLTSKEIVYDLYTGTGTIACFLAESAKSVIGIDCVPEAIKDAEMNAMINSINNTRFFAGDIRNVLSEDFTSENGRPDVIITDPPRAGMHKDVTEKILHTAPEKIVYVSCNPATQARDILLLSEKYLLKTVQPVDMFPQTAHVENVALLERIS
jgi:23S rRNA (uracil1939-C5)-methyltransferase